MTPSVGNTFFTLLWRLDHGLVLRELVDSAGDDLHLERRNGERHEKAPSDEDRQAWTPHHATGQRRPEARLAGRAPAAEQGNSTLFDPVTEPRQHRRQDRQRGEDGNRDHEDRAFGEGDERLVAADEHAGHRDDHGHAGDQHRTPRGSGGGLERGALAAPGGSLLALTPEVEERVVHTHCEPDQQDDRGEVAVGREEVARDRDQAQGGHHGRQPDQKRQTCRHERAEGDDEDDQGDRQREHPGLLEVAADDLVDGLVGTRAAELLDRQVGVIGLDGGNGGDRGIDAIGCLRRVARDLELHQRRVAVGRDFAVAG